MKIEVGRKYKIKQWDEMEEEYGIDANGAIDVPFKFIKDMRYLCGKIVKIETIEESDYYKVPKYRAEGKEWMFSREMFKSPLLELLIKRKLLQGEKS